jgi:hypothetical protein
VNEYDALADELAGLQNRVNDLIFDAVRAQMRGEDAEAALEREKRLSRVRRSLRKAEALLRGAVEED